jgi:hypothetical protein
VRERALGSLVVTIEQVLDDNQRIWVTGEVLKGNGVSARHGAGPQELQSLMAPYHLVPTACSYVATYLQGSPSFELYGIERRASLDQARGTLPESSVREP